MVNFSKGLYNIYTMTLKLRQFMDIDAWIPGTASKIGLQISSPRWARRSRCPASRKLGSLACVLLVSHEISPWASWSYSNRESVWSTLFQFVSRALQRSHIDIMSISYRYYWINNLTNYVQWACWTLAFIKNRSHGDVDLKIRRIWIVLNQDWMDKMRFQNSWLIQYCK